MFTNAHRSDRVKVNSQDGFYRNGLSLPFGCFNRYRHWTAQKWLLNCAQSFRKLIKGKASSLRECTWHSEDQHAGAAVQQYKGTALPCVALTQMRLRAHSFVVSHTPNYAGFSVMDSDEMPAQTIRFKIKSKKKISFSISQKANKHQPGNQSKQIQVRVQAQSH